MQRALPFQLEGAAQLLSKDWTSTQTFRWPPGLNHALRLLNQVQKCQTPSRLPERALCFVGVFQYGCLYRAYHSTKDHQDAHREVLDKAWCSLFAAVRWLSWVRKSSCWTVSPRLLDCTKDSMYFNGPISSCRDCSNWQSPPGSPVKLERATGPRRVKMS